MNYSGIVNCSIVDGIGFRTTLFISGCKHCCEGCQNSHTWDFNAGRPYTEEVEEILFDRISEDYIKGLTLSGGDPLYSADEVYELLVRFRERFGDKKSVWLYTGFKYEYCKEHFSKILDLCDVLVDGTYKCDERDTTLAFRGSRNQRVIDLKSGEEMY
jgi:anaerobic ribonucleoside-triphosphate reductase activating protein